ncbi:MAG: flippase [Candidatus Parcubacteria bacterium]|nr:flippase [Candidatus Parcubacteria bacterium]
MSLTRKIAHSTMIQFAGKIVGTFLGVITIAIMTRYLGQIGFGQYSTITAYLQFFAILVDMGLSVAVLRLISDPKNNQQDIFNNLFTLRFFSALIFLGIAPLIVVFFPYDNLIKIGIAVTTASFFFSALNQILISLYQKELKMVAVTVAEIAGRAILLTLTAIFAYLNYGLLAIMAAVVLGSLINFLINYIFALRYVKIKFTFNWPEWKKILKVTWPLALCIAFNLVYFKADTLILSLVRTQAEVGIYNAPYRVLEILVNFIFMFMGIVMPLLTIYWTTNNFEKFKEFFQKIFDLLLIVSLPMIFGTWFVARNLMTFIAGPDFTVSGDLLKILIIATAIIFINSIYGYTIVVLDKQTQMVKFYLINAAIALAGYIITIPLYGYWGAAVFTIISEAFIFIVNFIVVTKTTGQVPSLKLLPKIILATLSMCLVLALIPNLNVILQLLIASIVYLGALYLLKGIDKQLIFDIIRLNSEPEQPKIEAEL